MSVAIKICGLTSEKAVKTMVDAGANYAGFVYFPTSPRHITLDKAATLKAKLPEAVKTVLVVVDPTNALLNDIQARVKPDYIQLHGKETVERVHEVRSTCPQSKIIKAIKIKNSDDVASAMKFISVADALLFDAKPPELPGMLPGGNGLSFDWALLKNRDFRRPWFLSGGLHIKNVVEAIKESGAPMVDISSGVESAPGVKDPALIKAFIKKVRGI